MKATDFDKKFDDNEDVTGLLDLSKAKRPGLEVKRINVDFPEWMVESMDQEANRIGTTRQSLIKFWVADRLDHRASNQ
jgi:hypothetical protein